MGRNRINVHVSQVDLTNLSNYVKEVMRILAHVGAGGRKLSPDRAETITV